MSNHSSHVPRSVRGPEGRDDSAHEPSSMAILIPWKTTKGKVAVNFVFVLDYHLRSDDKTDLNEPPPGLPFMDGKDYPESSIYNFEYPTQNSKTMKDLLDPDKLLKHADDLLKSISAAGNGHNEESDIILVGYGYGGLISERATLLAKDRGDKLQIDGVILLGTPHFKAGLKQWAIICAGKPHNEEMKKGIADTPEEQNWKDYEGQLDKLIKNQDKFCNVCSNSNRTVNVVCCFAGVSGPPRESKQSLSAEWSLLSRFDAVRMPSTYTQLIAFTEVVSYSDVDKRVKRWLLRGRKKIAAREPNAKAIDDKVNSALRSIGRGNATRINWIYPAKLDQSITVGAIITKKDEFINLIASAALIDPQGTSKATVGFTESSGSLEIEQLTTQSAWDYLKKAGKLEDVRKCFSNSETKDIVYLVIGTETEHSEAKDTSSSSGVLSGTSNRSREQASLSQEGSRVVGLQLRLVRFTLRRS
ncbi:hypothetical protein F5Y12DRAFT_791759 [Xylaria sp. FL1777]|nr:hypothetical protein F5Y12DRAFT_791759 [Xylaria sp. FL1777]